MKLHMLALPHTVTRSDFSHCAFTGKVQRFAPMLRPHGLHVVHYGVEGSESGANEDVVILDRAEHLELLGVPDYHTQPRRQFGSDARSDSQVYRQFNYTLRHELEQRLEPGDVICLPFGAAHDPATASLPLVRDGLVLRVETGIGYAKPITLHRVYESEAWRHWTIGAESREGYGWRSPRMEWVIPNYYDLAAWPFAAQSDQRTVVFFGRVEEVKGCAIIPVLARAYPDVRFIICGQGDPTPYLTERNIEYRDPISGDERAQFLGSAAVVICPSRYVEPFCGTAVEAMLCGTPVLTSNFGAFTETNINGVTGFRCDAERSWITGIERAMTLNRASVRASAAARYDMRIVAHQYVSVFDTVNHTLQERIAVRPVGVAA